MSLTPDDVRNVSFRKPSVGMRGYDEDEVDAFLTEVERELGQLLEDNLRLRGRARHGDADYGSDAGSGYGSAPATLLSEIQGIRARIRDLRDAQDEAERRVRDLQSELEWAQSQAQAAPAGRRAESDGSGARMLAMAQRTADQHFEDARRTSEQVLSEARTRSEQVLGEAEAKALSTVEDAQQRHDDALARIRDEQLALQRQVKELTAFGQDYFSLLRADAEKRMPDLGTPLMPPLPPPYVAPAGVREW
ncbi:DivIVA domain-containing protein [Mangrovihabitans endophyticus]|uniref:Cell wall synthesis protein Wag31 n=1 Tax=Mangrovihabitans endophyticus TaxID=1751298 RepID=A0A8J3FS32_9ACTN|nr:DivIVA domain-containing protein [Mangrovihabitans endophyticus]GGL14544.1 hypothetical protein GCM10012284_56630 [Mangrovihabitans endophyticus]